MDINKSHQQQEQDYLDAISKAYDFKNALNKLTPQYKERFFRELTGASLTADPISEIMTRFQGGDF